MVDDLSKSQLELATRNHQVGHTLRKRKGDQTQANEIEGTLVGRGNCFQRAVVLDSLDRLRIRRELRRVFSRV